MALVSIMWTARGTQNLVACYQILHFHTQICVYRDPKKINISTNK